jgi:hypothetical protein
VGLGGGWPARFYVGLARSFMHMCLVKKGKAEAVEAEQHSKPAGHHLVSY